MDLIDDKTLTPLQKILVKNVHVEGKRHPLFATEQMGACLAKKRIKSKARRRFIDQQV